MATIAELKSLLTGYDYIVEYPTDSTKCKVRFCVKENRHLVSFEVDLDSNTMYARDFFSLYNTGASPLQMLELYSRVLRFVKASGIEIVR